MTGKGKDKVYIDSSQDFDDITRGHTSLGEGKDKYLIKGSKSYPSSTVKNWLKQVLAETR